VFDSKIASAEGIPRRGARFSYGSIFQKVLSQGGSYGRLIQNRSLVAIDDSPRYLFWSDRIPARVLCVSPWAKILAVLRNPVERSFSHYTMKATESVNSHLNITFEDFVDRDLKALQDFGVIREWRDETEFADFAGSDEELRAWKAYTRSGTQCVIGKGLYAIQLRH